MVKKKSRKTSKNKKRISKKRISKKRSKKKILRKKIRRSKKMLKGGSTYDDTEVVDYFKKKESEGEEESLNDLLYIQDTLESLGNYLLSHERRNMWIKDHKRTPRREHPNKPRPSQFNLDKERRLKTVDLLIKHSIVRTLPFTNSPAAPRGSGVSLLLNLPRSFSKDHKFHQRGRGGAAVSAAALAGQVRNKIDNQII